MPADVEGLQSCRPDERLLSMRICLQGDHLTKPEDVLVQLFEGELPVGLQVVRRRLLPAPSAKDLLRV